MAWKDPSGPDITDDHVEWIVSILYPEEIAAILAFPPKPYALSYSRLAESFNKNADKAERAGSLLKDRGLAKIRPVRMGNEYAGSALVLTEGGWRVRKAIEQRRPRK